VSLPFVSVPYFPHSLRDSVHKLMFVNSYFLYFQCAVDVNNTRTELVVSQFQDRMFIVVTQLDKIGTLVL